MLGLAQKSIGSPEKVAEYLDLNKQRLIEIGRELGLATQFLESQIETALSILTNPKSKDQDPNYNSVHAYFDDNNFLDSFRVLAEGFQGGASTVNLYCHNGSRLVEEVAKSFQSYEDRVFVKKVNGEFSLINLIQKGSTSFDFSRSARPRFDKSLEEAVRRNNSEYNILIPYTPITILDLGIRSNNLSEVVASNSSNPHNNGSNIISVGSERYDSTFQSLVRAMDDTPYGHPFNHPDVQERSLIDQQTYDRFKVTLQKFKSSGAEFYFWPADGSELVQSKKVEEILSSTEEIQGLSPKYAVPQVLVKVDPKLNGRKIVDGSDDPGESHKIQEIRSAFESISRLPIMALVGDQTIEDQIDFASQYSHSQIPKVDGLKLTDRLDTKVYSSAMDQIQPILDATGLRKQPKLSYVMLSTSHPKSYEIYFEDFNDKPIKSLSHSSVRDRLSRDYKLNARVLIVDDEEHVRTGVKDSLSDNLDIYNFEFAESEGGNQALTQLEQRPDLVILDMRMGKGPGGDFAVDSLEHQKGLDIIVYTGHSTDDQLVKAFQSRNKNQGHNVYLLTKDQQDELPRLVDQILRKKDLNSEYVLKN